MSAPDPRHVVELANEIVRAEDQLAALKSKWEMLFSPASERKPVARPSRENSIASQVLAAVNAQPEKQWSIDDLTKQLDVERETVSSSLYNLSKANKLARPYRGLYQSMKAVTGEPKLAESEAA